MGITPRQINVNFWRINPESINAYTEDITTKAFEGLDCTNFAEMIRSASHSLDAYAVEDKQGYITGALVRTQHADLPVAYTQKVRQFGKVPLNPGQGLSRVSCFVYEKRRRILLIESPGEGSSTANDWCLYFRTKALQDKGGSLPIIHAAIIESLDSDILFRKLTRITQLKVHIAHLRDVSMFRDAATSKAITTAMLNAKASGSDEITCEFKVPYRRPKKRVTDLSAKPGLKRSFVEKIVRAARGLDPYEITKLEVVGESEDLERQTPLNLLANRVTDKVLVVPFSDDQLPSEAAVRHHCDQIKQLFDKHALVLQSIGGA
jgi:hypothetical protein